MQILLLKLVNILDKLLFVSGVKNVVGQDRDLQFGADLYVCWIFYLVAVGFVDEYPKIFSAVLFFCYPRQPAAGIDGNSGFYIVVRAWFFKEMRHRRLLFVGDGGLSRNISIFGEVCRLSTFLGFYSIGYLGGFGSLIVFLNFPERLIVLWVFYRFLWLFGIVDLPVEGVCPLLNLMLQIEVSCHQHQAEYEYRYQRH